MRFGLFQEADPATPERYREMLQEAVFAEQMGFDMYLLPESHFVPNYGVSSPDVFFGAIAALTSRIKLRAAGFLMLKFNHPIRLAEQVATLDVLSEGRAEVGAARSINADMLEVFDISAKETRAQSEEALAIVAKALSGEPFEHHGEYWDIPARVLTPTPVQKPHPPLVYCSTGLDGHRLAGEKGIGVMSGGSLVGGWPYVREAVRVYKEAVTDAKPIGSYVLDSLGAYINRAHCAETMDEAVRTARDAAVATVEQVLGYYGKIAPQSPDYAYMSELGEIEEHKHDLEYLNEHGPFVTVGTPEYLVEKFSRLKECGADEIIVCIDALGHEAHMKAIELIGERVIPNVA
jgi:alkanesulfonate monooxygenase SsuD/methylene tetrahydromethanopterin reductase-like flavin-dependent oxidoreductase (luciferase family)